MQANGKAEFQDVVVRGTVEGSLFTTDGGAGPYIEIDGVSNPDKIAFYTDNVSELFPGFLRVGADFVALGSADLGGDITQLYLDGTGLLVSAPAVYVSDDDQSTADVVRLGTQVTSFGVVNPSPGNRLEFDAIAEDGAGAATQNRWTIDADAGMVPEGETSLAMRSTATFSDGVSSPVNVERDVMTLRSGLTTSEVEFDVDNFFINTHDVIGEWTEWFPSFLNITLGAGAISTHRYKQVGKLVYVSGHIKLGTGGTLGGSTAEVSVPVTPWGGVDFGVGSFIAIDASAPRYYVGSTMVDVDRFFFLHSEAAGNGVVRSGAPFAWAVNDEIWYSAVYEAA